jgi:hypothetical protein
LSDADGNKKSVLPPETAVEPQPATPESSGSSAGRG